MITDFKNNKPPFIALKTILEKAMDSNLEASSEYSMIAIDLFPDSPFFYLSRGKAFQIQKKYQQAIDVLKGRLDFMIDNSVLEEQFFETLIKAYSAINTPSKVLEFKKQLRKIHNESS